MADPSVPSKSNLAESTQYGISRLRMINELVALDILCVFDDFFSWIIIHVTFEFCYWKTLRTFSPLLNFHTLLPEPYNTSAVVSGDLEK